MTPLRIDLKQRSLDPKCNLAKSVVLDGMVMNKASQYSESSIMICGQFSFVVIDVDTMNLIKTIKINTKVRYVNDHDNDYT